MKSNYTLVGLKRWSAKSKEIPGVATVKSIHVYDFDNTLFCSPLPNPQLWNPSSIGLLQTYEVFASGGWWHDPTILAATGEGIEKEEPCGWEGWWNETVVDLVRTSMEQADVLTVLLTGRNETDFADLVNRICNAKQLDFDLVVLKPEAGPSGQLFGSTLLFKQEFFKELSLTYKHADEIRIYEDRPKHVKGFREYFERLNKSFLSHPVEQPPPPRKPITAEVIHVCELKSNLDPDVEVDVIQKAVMRHNQIISSGGPNRCGAPNRRYKLVENFVYFGYLINQTDSARLITLCNAPPHLIDNGEVRFMASSILITPFYPRKDILNKVGGRGKKVTWQVTGVAKFEDRIWAARVSAVGETQIYTQDHTPTVVLAIRKGSRPIDVAKIHNWQPVASEKAFMFETTVGDKVMLKLEEDDANLDNNTHEVRRYRQRIDNEAGFKRKYGTDDDFKGRERTGDRHGQGRYFSQSKQQFNNRNNRNMNGNGGRRNEQGLDSKPSSNTRSRGGGGSNRGRPGNRGPGYKSLDDYGPGNFDGSSDIKGNSGNSEMVMNY